MVAVGRLLRVRGNRGELVGEVYSSQPGRAEKLKKVFLEREGQPPKPLEVENVWWHDGRPVFKFAGVDSISAAETLAGSDILVADEDRAQPEEGEYSHADLAGCELWDRGELVGVVRAVQDFGGTPLLVLEKKNGGEALVPFARSICKEIDVGRKKIGAELPEGLLE